MPWFLVALAALLAFWFALWRCVERYEEHLWRTVAFVARRIAPYRYLSLHLLAGLAVCFGAVFAFGSLAEEILETLNRHATPLGADALSAITRLGDTWVIARWGSPSRWGSRCAASACCSRAGRPPS